MKQDGGMVGQVALRPGADMGYSMSEATMTLSGPDGGPVTEHVRDFYVWRRQADGSWKVVVDIWNAAPPPQM